MKTTKKLIWNQAPPNNRTRLVIYGYAFSFDKDLRPIPTEVPIEVANMLLQMQGREHTCCPNSDVEPMFLEVQ